MSPASTLPPRTLRVSAGLPASRAASMSALGRDGRGGALRPSGLSVVIGRVNVGRDSRGVTVPPAGGRGRGRGPLHPRARARGSFTLSALVQDADLGNGALEVMSMMLP